MRTAYSVLRIACCVLCLLVVASSAQAQVPATTVNVILKTNTVRIRRTRDAQVRVRLKDANGKLRAQTERFISASAGPLDVELYTASGFPAIIHPGDSIVVLPDGEDSILVSAVYLDARPVADSDTLAVTGPPNAELNLQVWSDLFTRYDATATTDGAGQSLLRLAGIVDLRPGVYGWVGYEPAPGRAVVVSFQVPTAVAKVGSDWMQGYVWAEREVSLVLEDDASQPVATTRLLSDGRGYFETRLAEEFAGLRIEPGQTIHIIWEDQEITLAVPELAIRADPQQDRIVGHGPAGGNLSITIYDQATRRRWWYQTTAGQNGQYQVELAGRVDLNPNDDGSVFYTTPEGHKLVAEFRVPLIRLEVGSGRVGGRGVENASVAVDLRATDGTLKATAVTTVDARGDFEARLEAAGQPVPVAGGDHLEVTIGDEFITMDVPTLSVRLDADRERVAGQGPPGQRLAVTLDTDDGQYTEPVTPDTTGTYLLDFQGRADIRAGTAATVTYITPGEHLITTRTRLTRVTVQAGANYVTGLSKPEARVEVFLHTADGQLKDWARTTADHRGRFAVSLQTACRTPVAVEAGDGVMVQTGDETVALEVPLLTAVLDPASDTLTGLAPPGATLQVKLSTAQGYRRDEVTVRGDGRYTFTYGPDIDVQPGDSAAVVYTDPRGHQAFARANAPVFRATLGDSVLRGQVQPLETVRVALLAGDQRPPRFPHKRPNVGLRDPAGIPTWPDRRPKPGRSERLSRAEARVTGDRNGAFAVQLRDDAGQPVRIRAGDTIEVQTVDATYHLPVPPLTLTLDPAIPGITGTALPYADVDIVFVSGSAGYLQQTVTTDGEGRYRLALDADIALRGSDWARATLVTPEGFRAMAWDTVPQITVQVGSNDATVQLTPGAPVTVTLWNAEDSLRATASGTTDPSDGKFEAYFVASDGEPVAVQPGDRIVLEETGVGPIASLAVPHLTLRLEPGTHTVLGQAPPGTSVYVSAAGTGGEDPRSRSASVWSDGTFGARFAGLELGAGAWASVSLRDPDTGHRAFRTTYRGWLSARIDGHQVQVRAEPLSEVILTLRAADGTLKATQGPTRVNGHGETSLELAAADGTPATIRAGDRLELATVGGVTALVIPPVELRIDVATCRVSGHVPGPGSTRIELTTGACTYEWHPRPGPDGQFAADFAPDTAIRPGDVVHLFHTTASGHQIEMQRHLYGVYLALIGDNFR